MVMREQEAQLEQPEQPEQPEQLAILVQHLQHFLKLYLEGLGVTLEPEETQVTEVLGDREEVVLKPDIFLLLLLLNRAYLLITR
jgi:hypothetical protein